MTSKIYVGRDSFRFRRAVFYNGLKSKVGLAAAKTAAMQPNLNIDGCGVVAPPVHSSSRAPLLLASTFLLYHKTVVAVNALSARVTEGVPINNSLSL